MGGVGTPNGSGVRESRDEKDGKDGYTVGRGFQVTVSHQTSTSDSIVDTKVFLPTTSPWTNYPSPFPFLISLEGVHRSSESLIFSEDPGLTSSLSPGNHRRNSVVVLTLPLPTRVQETQGRGNVYHGHSSGNRCTPIPELVSGQNNR